MASRAGRKRSFGHRQPNGELKRPTMQQIADLDLARRQEHKQVVLAQPHRRGNTDQRCATAIGRFFIRNPRLRRELPDAAERYAALKRRWRAAWGVRTMERASEGSGSGLGPSATAVRRWGAEITMAERAMMEASPAGYFAVRLLVLEDADIGTDQEAAAVVSLTALAVQLELMKEDSHPFAARA